MGLLIQVNTAYLCFYKLLGTDHKREIIDFCRSPVSGIMNVHLCIKDADLRFFPAVYLMCS